MCNSDTEVLSNAQSENEYALQHWNRDAIFNTAKQSDAFVADLKGCIKSAYLLFPEDVKCVTGMSTAPTLKGIAFPVIWGDSIPVLKLCNSGELKFNTCSKLYADGLDYITHIRIMTTTDAISPSAVFLLQLDAPSLKTIRIPDILGLPFCLRVLKAVNLERLSFDNRKNILSRVILSFDQCAIKGITAVDSVFRAGFTLALRNTHISSGELTLNTQMITYDGHYNTEDFCVCISSDRFDKLDMRKSSCHILSLVFIYAPAGYEITLPTCTRMKLCSEYKYDVVGMDTRDGTVLLKGTAPKDILSVSMDTRASVCFRGDINIYSLELNKAPAFKDSLLSDNKSSITFLQVANSPALARMNYSNFKSLHSLTVDNSAFETLMLPPRCTTFCWNLRNWGEYTTDGTIKMHTLCITGRTIVIIKVYARTFNCNIARLLKINILLKGTASKVTVQWQLHSLQYSSIADFYTTDRYISSDEKKKIALEALNKLITIKHID